MSGVSLAEGATGRVGRRPKERRDSGHNDLFRARLDWIIDASRPLARLAAAIGQWFLEARFAAVVHCDTEIGRLEDAKAERANKMPTAMCPRQRQTSVHADYTWKRVQVQAQEFP